MMKPSVNPSDIQSKQLTEVVVHAAAVFQSRKNMNIFKPFVNILNSPSELKVFY